MHKNIISSKIQLTINEKKKLRKVMRKRGKVPLYPYFHPQSSKLSEYLLVEWACTIKFNNKSAKKCIKMHKNNRSKI